MFKKVLAMAMCGVMAVSMMGCGSGKNNSKDKAGELTILTADDTTEGGALKAMAEKYQEETGVKVTMTEIPYGDLESKLLNMIKAGDAPGVVRFAGFANFTDYLVDLSEIAPSEDTMLLATQVDGKTLALPANTTANGMVYNKTLFDQAGVAVPTGDEDLWTWEEFRAALKTVVEKTDAEYGMVWDHSQQRYATMLFQYGGSFYSEDLTEVKLRSEASKKCLNDFLSMFEDGTMPKSTWAGTEDPQAMFKTGKVAVHMCGNWVLNDYKNNIKDFEWAPVLMPKETQRATVFGGNYIFAMQGSGMEEEAKKFLKWFYEPENYAEYCKKGNYLPGQKGIEVEYDVVGMDVFKNELEAAPSIAKTNEAIGVKYPGRTWGNVLRDGIDEAIAGTKTADQVLEEAEKAVLEAYPEMKAAE